MEIEILAAADSSERVPLIVGIGGGATPGSSTDQALSFALRSAAAHGARTMIFGVADLAPLPMYINGARNGRRDQYHGDALS